jgi:hypothetical protein
VSLWLLTGQIGVHDRQYRSLEYKIKQFRPSNSKIPQFGHHVLHRFGDSSVAPSLCIITNKESSIY